MKHFQLLLLFLLAGVLNVFAQKGTEAEAEQIKHNPQLVWGQGVGETLQAADEMAVRDLISQISVTVDSRTETQIHNDVRGQEASSSVSTTSDLHVSSNVSLSNCKRLVYTVRGRTIVLRYVDRAEIEKMFDARKAKIFDLAQAGERAEEQGKVSDALRNSYWALKLIYSIPVEHREGLTTEEGIQLSTALQERIASILDSLTLRVESKEEVDGQQLAHLQMTYKGRPVVCCDYAYFDGYDWINASAKNGRALAELPASSRRVRLRVEYVFEKLWKSDPLVNDMLSQLPERIPFPQYEKKAELEQVQVVQEPLPTNARALAKEIEVDSIAACSKKEVRNQADILLPVITAIEKKQYADVKQYFTPNGWKWFEKLIQYGNAKIIARDEIQVSSFANGYLLRGIKASFSFKKNNKSFIEDIVFYVKDDKIEGVNFGLEEGALADIMRHEMWNPESRLVLVNFLENYKTAYALERLDYLEAVFSDDALIIVGNRIPEQRVSEVTAMDTERYEHNRLTKSQYISQLEKVFKKQEYVNIHFEDAAVKKTSRNDERYEIIIKQNYYSASYADKGYLYLLADISNPEQPIIHVRVWDENRNNLMNYGEWIF